MGKVRANPRWSVPGNSGSIANGWKVYTYVAGTSTNKDTYTDYLEGTPNTNPVILDARGEATIYWSGTYKVIVKDADDVTIWTEDNYGGGEDVIQPGNYNLVKNGSFETDTLTRGEPDYWTIVDYTNGSHSLDATDQFHGLNSLKFTSTGSGGGYATSDYFEVEEAKALNFDWNMKSTVANVRNVVDVLWYTAAKTLISTTNLYDDSATNTTSWSAKYSQSTPPSTARYSQLRVYGCHSSDTTAGSTWYDNIEVGPNLARRHTVNTFTQTQTWSKGADVASAAALTLGSDGNYFDITGTAAITSIVSKGIGTVVKLHFDGILTLTHHATDLILPAGANITTAAGDEAEFVEYASGDWRCTSYPPNWIIAPVTNFLSSLETHINEYGSWTPVTPFDVDANVTESTWESIGPTGSGADNIVSGMDIIPASAKAIIARIYAVGRDTATGGVYSLDVYARKTGSGLSTGSHSRIYGHSLYTDATSAVGGQQLSIVPLDSSRRFDLLWFNSATAKQQSIIFHFLGWI